MEAKDYLAFIVKEIHTSIVATVDDEGLPVTAAIDMMDSDEASLYFLTAKGKGFYDRLIKRGYLAHVQCGRFRSWESQRAWLCKNPRAF